jgi:hypothetical protein
MKQMFPLFILLFALLACGVDNVTKNEDELQCENYFLAIDNETGKLFYNTDGLLSEYVNNSDTFFVFAYNELDQIKRIDGAGFVYRFRYDEENVLMAFLTPQDSIAIVHDGQSRIIKRDYYGYEGLRKSLINTYENLNTSKMEIYNYNNVTQQLEKTNTFLYTYDTNPTPYPAELQLANSLMSGGHINVNNTTSITIVGGEPGNILPIKYNSDGYPVLIAEIPYVYTCEPTPRGVQ